MFKIENNVLVEYSGNDKVVIIPNGVEVIDSGAFAYNKLIQEIYIPNSVKKIKKHAFQNSLIKKVFIDIESELKTIGAFAFCNCVVLESIYFPNKLKEIKKNAFLGCVSLKNISLPNGLTHVGYHAFGNTGFENNLHNYDNYILYSNNVLIKVSYLYDNLNNGYEHIKVKDNTYLIADGAFENCKANYYTLPNSLEYIGNMAFAGSQVEKIEIPDSVFKIGNEAFLACKKLVKIKLGNKMKTIPKNCFYSCNNLKTVVLPEGLIKINDYAFVGCYRLNKIELPNKIKDTLLKGFFDSGIEEIVFPNSYDTINLDFMISLDYLKKATFLSNKIKSIEWSDKFESLHDCTQISLCFYDEKLKNNNRLMNLKFYKIEFLSKNDILKDKTIEDVRTYFNWV